MTRRCVGVILAGGTASRMGGKPKGLIPVGGKRIIDRLAGELRVTTNALILSANADDAGSWLPGVAVVRDARHDIGALAGIESALRFAASDLLVVGWDMPFVPARVLSALVIEGEESGALMVAPESKSSWGFEPLCAWYSADILPLVVTQLDAGLTRIGALAGAAKVRTIDVTSLGDPAEMFLNVNSPDDLARAEELATSGRYA